MAFVAMIKVPRPPQVRYCAPCLSPSLLARVRVRRLSRWRIPDLEAVPRLPSRARRPLDRLCLGRSDRRLQSACTAGEMSMGHIARLPGVALTFLMGCGGQAGTFDARPD